MNNCPGNDIILPSRTKILSVLNHAIYQIDYSCVNIELSLQLTEKATKLIIENTVPKDILIIMEYTTLSEELSLLWFRLQTTIIGKINKMAIYTGNNFRNKEILIRSKLDIEGTIEIFQDKRQALYWLVSNRHHIC